VITGNEVRATIYGKIKKTVKHTLIFGIGSVVNSAFGLVLVPLYTRYLRASEFGVLSLLTITLTLITIVLKFGLNQAFFRHYYDTENPSERRRIVGSTLIFLLASGLLSTGLLYLIAPQVSWLIFSGDSGQANLLRLIFFIGFFEIISVIPDSILRANFKSAHYSALNIAAFVFQLSAICYFVIGVDASVQSVLRGRLIGSVFETAIFFFVVRRDLSLNFSSPELRGLLAFGTPLIFNQIAMTLFMMVDRFFLERFAKARDVGVYAIANTLVSVVSVLATVPFSQVWTVMRFSVMNEEGAEEYYSRVLTYITFVSMFLSLGVAAVAGDGLLRFARPDYWPATSIIPMLALSMVLDSASRVLNIGITLKKRTIYAPITIALALAFNVAINFVLIPRYGSFGAAISTLLSYVVFCILRFWASNLFFKVHYEWGRIFTMGVIGSLIFGAYYTIDYLRGDVNAMSYEDPWRRRLIYLSAAIKVALALAFPLILLALGFYDERERRRLTGIWRQGVSAVRNRKLNAEAVASADNLPINSEESFDAGD
jgi:O-antigen/teichoic acid export membrane protein